MFKQTLIAALTLSALSIAPAPVVTGTALAQSNCPTGATYCRPDHNPRTSTQRCTDDMGHLRRVYEEELAGISNPSRVFVWPICEGVTDGVMRNYGNAGALRQAVADNDALTEALWRKNFRPDDVIGIRMRGDDAVTLYVYEFFRLYR